MKLRISARVLGHLSGSQAWQDPLPDYNDLEEVKLMERLQEAKPRKDGSISIDLDAAERACLYEYVELMAIGARDNIGPWDYGDALADYNAASALMRHIDKARSAA